MGDTAQNVSSSTVRFLVIAFVGFPLSFTLVNIYIGSSCLLSSNVRGTHCVCAVLSDVYIGPGFLLSSNAMGTHDVCAVLSA